jgi:hypothetical protein
MYQLNYGISDTPRNAFQLMIDVNRCLLLTTQPPIARLKSAKPFSQMLLNLVEITPAPFEDRLYQKR